MEKNKKIILISVFAILTIFIIGVIIGYFIPGEVKICTEMWCPPAENASGITEVECNACMYSNVVFSLGLFSIVENCDSKEVLIFENGEHKDMRYDVNKSSCEKDFVFLKQNI